MFDKINYPDLFKVTRQRTEKEVKEILDTTHFEKEHDRELLSYILSYSKADLEKTIDWIKRCKTKEHLLVLSKLIQMNLRVEDIDRIFDANLSWQDILVRSISMLFGFEYETIMDKNAEELLSILSFLNKV